MENKELDNVIDEDFDFSKKKKRKVTKITTTDPYDDLDEDYAFLLKRVFRDFISNKEESKKHIDPPEVLKSGTKKVIWANFASNCKSINRNPQHVMKFVLAELSTNGSLGDNLKLIISGRFQSKQFESVLKKYITEYVTCSTCKGPNTELKKENRILFKTCKDCKASSSINNIKNGFQTKLKKK